MCLTINKEKTETLKKSGQEMVTRYKVVKRDENCIVSVFYPSYIWKEGWNISNSVVDWLDDAYTICNGIHVFVLKEDAEKLADNKLLVMEVICHINDLKAVGSWWDVLEVNYVESEVYRQVFVEKLPV